MSLLAQMGLPIMCGIVWGIIKPGGLDAVLTRRVLTTVVFNVLLPALILSVFWHSDIGVESLKIALFGISIVVFGMALIWLLSKVWRLEPRRLGAAMLATGFANVTYLGLPVLEQTFGSWVRSLVIQIDLFASMPMVLVMGAVIGRHYGEASGQRHRPVLLALASNPPLLSALLAVLLNAYGVPSLIG